MRRRFVRTFLVFVLTAGLTAGAALAQDEEGRSWFTAFLESLVSTPERQVRISGFDGVFSANPKIARVTVADADGVWLEFDGIEMAWNRAALFDRTIDIESLKATRVAMLRKPAVVAEKQQGGGGTSPPPVAIDIKAISLPQIVLSPDVAGEAAELTAYGSAEITQEALGAELVVDRQDRAGSLALKLHLAPQDNVLTADVKFEEPAGGLAAELLHLRDRPAVAVTLAGTGPLDAWRGTTEVEVGGGRVLAGGMAVSRVADEIGRAHV